MARAQGRFRAEALRTLAESRVPRAVWAVLRDARARFTSSRSVIRHDLCTIERMVGFRKRQRKDIGERIARWEPLVLEKTAHGWRATKLTRTGHFTATAITVRAALTAAASRAEASFAL